MIASRARVPLVIVLGLVVAGLCVALARFGLEAARATGARVVSIHVKLRADPSLASLRPIAADVAPLFTHLEPGTHDARRQWIVVRARGEDVAWVTVELLADPAVVDAFVAPEIGLADRVASEEPPGDSCPISTPSFESYQGYLGPAPGGIDAPAAWRRGHRGAGVWFADVEGGWNAGHEDLPGDRITHVAGTRYLSPAWRQHGTAVLGEVVGRDNGKGVVGIAPEVERVFTSSIGGTTVADAIDVAARALRPGDVLLIELQGAGPRGRYVPVEYWDDVFDAIQAATGRGVVVVEAAGNGAEDLDHRVYDRKFDRTRRDSGAIIVGAGGPPRDGFVDRARLDFSNYGARVDVQGWGRKVATLDYGDLQACAGVDRHYTGEFAGTSSASPIVAGAAVILEGIARGHGGWIAPRELRELVRRTGTPQAGDTRQAIGPRPDLARAMLALERRGGQTCGPLSSCR